MSTTERRGRFITFEGPDGSGKTTQMQILAERLAAEGRDVVVSAEPGGTRIGRQIRTILLDPSNTEMCAMTELLLYFSARAQNVAEQIVPALERGAIVLSDRFTDSTIAYQGAARGLGREVVEQLHGIACSGLQPDRTICLDVDTAQALDRVGGRAEADRLEGEAEAFHRRVREEYLKLAAEFPGRILLIDASGSIESVAGSVWRAVFA